MKAVPIERIEEFLEEIKTRRENVYLNQHEHRFTQTEYLAGQNDGKLLAYDHVIFAIKEILGGF